MNIQNFAIKSSRKRNNNPLLPSSLRGLIVGRSNSGKTVLLLNLLLREGWLDYNNLLVFGNSLHQEEYRIIKKGLEIKLGKEQLLNLFNNQKLISPLEAIENYKGKLLGGITAEFYENCEAIPDPKTLDPKLKNLIILDDCYLGSQSKAGAYYSRGRHNNCDSLYISQNYFTLPRNSVRENSNLIILFPQNNKSVSHIHQDHCTDLSFEEFKALCEHIWETKFNFLVIDLSSSLLDGKYRKNFESFYIPQAFLSSSDDMAFIDIPNPSKRKEIVQEYIKMKNEIWEKNENKKASNLLKEQEIEEKFRPIISATEKSAEKITSALEKHAESSTPYEFYSSLTKNRDKYFSIYRTNGGFFRIGNTDIQIDEGSTIHIDDMSYEYTPGLWDLLMLNKPDDGEYTDEDRAKYKQIVELTDLINNPHIPNSKSNYKITGKYKFLENLLGIVPVTGKRRRIEKKGEGIILPGDINSLKDRLRLVYGERAAGNVEATTPEMVAILDEFLRRKHISKSEYNAVCNELGC